MCTEHWLSFKGVLSQFAQLQKYADFLDPLRMPPCHLFGPPPCIRVCALLKDVHDYNEWKRDLHHSIVLDCNEQWSWDFTWVPMVPKCLFWPTKRPPCPDSGFWFRGTNTQSPMRPPTLGLCLICGRFPSVQQYCMMSCGATWHSVSCW